MSDKAALHPDRIAAALRVIDMESVEDEKVFDSCYVETFEAALKLIQKIQQKTGLTPAAADLGAHVLGVLKGLKSLR